MAYGDPQLLHLDTMLSGVSVGYRNLDLIGDELFPTVRVQKQSDKYYVYEKTGFTPIDDVRGPYANTNELPPISLSRDSYFAEEHALKDWVAREEEEAADNPLTPRIDATERVSDTILIARENAIKTMVTTTTNYATGHSVTLSGTGQWSDYANSNPITDLKAARDKIQSAIFRMPNIAVLGYEVASKLEDHPKFLDRIKTSPLATNDLDNIGQIVGIPRLLRASAGLNTAALGQAQTIGYLWGKDVVVAYVPPGPSLKTPAFAYEYNFPFDGQVMPSDTWYDNDRKSTAIRVTRRYDLKFAAVDAVATGKAVGGYLIKAAIA